MIHERIPDYVVSTVRGLYCDGQLPALGSTLTFYDPLVRVHTVEGNLSMFKKLRAIFPATELSRLEPLESKAPTEDLTTTRYLMVVTYKRGASGRGYPMRSHLAVTTVQGVVIGLEEDWRAPIRIGANSVPALHGVRGLLGRIFGM